MGLVSVKDYWTYPKDGPIQPQTSIVTGANLKPSTKQPPEPLKDVEKEV